MPTQEPRQLDADVPDPEGEEQRGERLLPRCVDGVEQLLRGFLCEPLQGEQAHEADPLAIVEVGHRLDQLGVEQGLHSLGPEPPDVHRSS